MQKRITNVNAGERFQHEGHLHTVMSNKGHTVRANKNILQLRDRFGIVQTYTFESNKTVKTF